MSVVDIDMPFASMVGFMIKLALAAVPAGIILFIIGFFVTIIMAAVGMSLR